MATALVFQSIFKALGVAPKIWRSLRDMRKKITDDDRKMIRQFVRRLDERRVFSAPYNVEVVEVCLVSIRDAKAFTEDALVTVDHPLARAALGALLDSFRRFLDSWSAYRQSREPWDGRRHHGDESTQRQHAEFFRDLGELRGHVKTFVGMLITLEPKASAPNLFGETQTK